MSPANTTRGGRTTLVAIDRAEVRRISRLAHVELDAASIDSLRRDLQSILDHVALLDELDVTSVDPTAVVTDPPAGLREDAARPSLTGDDALANAPDAFGGHFRVPRVLGP
jgi:aspartyl-tRNA(Asn)/glutamyl-tRNA(Gln) amidotransferase subunit C